MLGPSDSKPPIHPKCLASKAYEQPDTPPIVARFISRGVIVKPSHHRDTLGLIQMLAIVIFELGATGTYDYKHFFNTRRTES
jgi:hypothetical protein